MQKALDVRDSPVGDLEKDARARDGSVKLLLSRTKIAHSPPLVRSLHPSYVGS